MKSFFGSAAHLSMVSWAIGNGLSWGIGFLAGGGVFGGSVGGVIGGAIGGLLSIIVLHRKYQSLELPWQDIGYIVLSWLLGGSVGGALSRLIGETYGFGPFGDVIWGLGFVVGGMVTGAIGGLGMIYVIKRVAPPIEGNALRIVADWMQGFAIGGGIGMTIIVAINSIFFSLFFSHEYTVVTASFFLGGLVSGMIAGVIGSRATFTWLDSIKQLAE